MPKKRAKRDARLIHGAQLLEAWGIGSSVGEDDVAAVSRLTERVGEHPDADLAIADSLGHIVAAESVRFLVDWEARAADRRLKKEISRALYRLSQKGVQTERSETDGASSILTPIEPEGYLSPMDGRGDRLVWLVKPRVGGGLHFLSSLINEPDGMRYVEGTVVTRKALRQARQDLTERHGLGLIEAPWRYCDFLMSEGYDRANAEGGDKKREVAQYPAVRSHLLTAPAEPHPVPLPNTLDRAAIAADQHLLADSARLLEEPEIQRWLFDAEQAKPYIDKMTSAQESPLVLNRFQQKDRVEDVIKEAVSDLFSDRGPYTRRLEETAVYLAATGRTESAQRALAVSVALQSDGADSRTIPFCERLVRQGIGLHYDAEKQQERETAKTSLIMKPSEFAARSRQAPQQRPRT